MDARVTDPWRPRRPGRQESNPPDLWVPGELDARAALLARARSGDAEALQLVEERYRVRLYLTAPAPTPTPAPTPARPTTEGGVLCDGCGEPMTDQRRRRGARKRYHGPTCRNRAYRRKHRPAA